MNTIYSSGIISLNVQVVTGILDIIALMKPVKGPLIFVKQLLWIEFLVQLVEASFYVWLISKIHRQDITHVRYYDWVFTTPTMLFTYIMYLIYIHDKSVNYSLYDTTMKHLNEILPIFGLNTAMLFFGFLAEIKRIPALLGVVLGFIPYFSMFIWIYYAFARESKIGRYTFWYFSGVWGLYGVAALMPYVYKNISYNVLDIFSKNFFGLFLAGVILLYGGSKTEAKVPNII